MHCWTGDKAVFSNLSILQSCNLAHALCILASVALLLTACQLGSPTPAPTSTPDAPTPTPTVVPTLSPAEQGLYPTYAGGELLPHMRVPLQRSASGEGGWFVIIGSEEGWGQFLSQMGQPAEIWEPVAWEDDILVGVLLGVRQGRGHEMRIARLNHDGVTAVASVSFGTPTPEQAASNWVTYPFHMIRVPRSELVLGLVSFSFVSAGQVLAEQDVDMIDLDIVWLPGQAAVYPTPTPAPTLVPVPTTTPTPVPHLQVAGTVLEVLTDTLSLRISPVQGRWQTIQLLEGTSIFGTDGTPATLSQLAPGAAINALGYEQEGRTMRAAHIDVLRASPAKDVFAEYRPRTVTLSTIYDGYRLPLDTDDIWSVVPLSESFSLTQTAMLARNGFVVVPGDFSSLAELYEASTVGPDGSPAEDPWPVYVSADSVLHVTRLALGRVQRAVEQQHLLPELELLDREMYALSWAQFEAAEGLGTPETERLAATALRNAGYFAVALSLLDAEFVVPEVLTPVVEAELALIAAGEAITLSPLLGWSGVPDEPPDAASGGELDDTVQRVDYRAFAPSGQVLERAGEGTVDEALARYQRASTWHRQVAFRPDRRQESRSAALIAHTLMTHPAARVLWQRLCAVLDFFHGRDASYTAAQYADLVSQVWDDTGSPSASLTALADEERMGAFLDGIGDLSLPENPIWTIWAAKQPLRRDWRLFGHPFRLDEYVFQKTTGQYVGSPAQVRALPSGIDLAAALGSLEAYRVADEIGFTRYMNYVEQVDKVRNELSAVPAEHWTREQHWNWLHVYRRLLQEKNASYPAWMNTAAWKRRTLQAELGAWTHLLYKGPSGASALPSVDEGPAIAEDTPAAGAPDAGAWGYVEPQPEVYARLAALTRLVVDGLESRLMLPAAEREMLLELEDWLAFLQDAARRELIVAALTDDEYRRLGEWGAFVSEITQAAVADLAPAEGQPSANGYSEVVAIPIAVAAGEQLVEATGPVDEIYVAVERGRQVFLARGGVYAQYEFTWPGEEAMTTAAWRELLARGLGPERPSWLAGVVIEE